jgi:hypothetical protein
MAQQATKNNQTKQAELNTEFNLSDSDSCDVDSSTSSEGV